MKPEFVTTILSALPLRARLGPVRDLADLVLDRMVGQGRHPSTWADRDQLISRLRNASPAEIALSGLATPELLEQAEEEWADGLHAYAIHLANGGDPALEEPVAPALTAWAKRAQSWLDYGLLNQEQHGELIRIGFAYVRQDDAFEDAIYAVDLLGPRSAEAERLREQLRHEMANHLITPSRYLRVTHLIASWEPGGSEWAAAVAGIRWHMRARSLSFMDAVQQTDYQSWYRTQKRIAEAGLMTIAQRHTLRALGADLPPERGFWSLDWGESTDVRAQAYI